MKERGEEEKRRREGRRRRKRRREEWEEEEEREEREEAAARCSRPIIPLGCTINEDQIANVLAENFSYHLRIQLVAACYATGEP